MSEKTEQPTQKRVDDARRKGQVARSRLSSGGAVTFCALAALLASLPSGSARLTGWAARVLADPAADPLSAASEGAWELAALLAPAAAAAFLAALVSGVALAGWRVTPVLLLPRAERIDPFAGAGRLFGVRAVLDTGKAVLAAVVVVLVAWSAARPALPDTLRAVRAEGAGAVLVSLDSVRTTALRAAGALLVLAALDFGLAKRRHRKDLMMTREEVRNEHKEAEGDPRHKGHRKAMHRQLAAGGPARGVRHATAVVVNPTHVAVALRYDTGECEAPYLVAKGREMDALRLRREAERLGIPVVRDVPLARSLVQYEVGMEIPEELYQAAAAVLTAALELDTRPRRRT